MNNEFPRKPKICPGSKSLLHASPLNTTKLFSNEKILANIRLILKDKSSTQLFASESLQLFFARPGEIFPMIADKKPRKAELSSLYQSGYL
jgi:hypothetical protein